MLIFKLSVFTTLTFMLLFLGGCKKSIFTEEERLRILEGNTDTVMPIFTIYEKNDSISLRCISRKVTKEDINSDLVYKLKAKMLSTVNDSLNQGVGIAAPQVGVNVMMIYVQRFDKESKPFEVFFNPVISEYGDSLKVGREGCLSVPKYWGRVERPQSITVSYLNSEGNYQKESIKGFTAVIFQHEFDHLSGKFYYDHIHGGFNSLLADE